jgi:F-type H+-transporting ATPase subunit delta
MAEFATIARPYAEALFRVAKNGNIAAWSDLVSQMAQVATYPEVRALAQNPLVSDEQLADTFVAALGPTSVTAEAKNLISVLVDNDRLALLPEIAEQFHVLKNADAGSADVQIESAFALTDAQLKDLVVSLEKKFGRKLNPTVSINEALIGGVCVTVGDEVFDTSVRAKLQQLQAALAA